MRELYLDLLEAKTYLQATPTKIGLQPFLNLDLVLPTNGKYLKYPEGYERMPLDNVTPICCNLLITNRNHDGIWLYADWKKGTIDIPRKNMGERDLSNIEYGRPEYAIMNTVMDVIDQNRDLNEVMMRHNLGIPYILDGYGFEAVEMDFDHSFFYSFYTELENIYNIFYVIEVDKPMHMVPEISDFIFGDFIWYGKNDHVFNKRYYNKMPVFDSHGCEFDVRIDDYGIALLDQIFHTEILFGKLDIY